MCSPNAKPKFKDPELIIKGRACKRRATKMGNFTFKYHICHLTKVKLQTLKVNISFWLVNPLYFPVLWLRLLFAMTGVVLVTLQTRFASRMIHYIAIFDKWTIPQLDKVLNWKTILAQLERASLI